MDSAFSDEDKLAFVRFSEGYESFFSTGDHDLSCATAAKHRIDTESPRPDR